MASFKTYVRHVYRKVRHPLGAHDFDKINLGSPMSHDLETNIGQSKIDPSLCDTSSVARLKLCQEQGVEVLFGHPVRPLSLVATVSLTVYENLVAVKTPAIKAGVQ